MARIGKGMVVGGGGGGNRGGAGVGGGVGGWGGVCAAPRAGLGRTTKVQKWGDLHMPNAPSLLSQRKHQDDAFCDSLFNA